MSRVFVRQMKSNMSCSVEERRALLKLGLGHIGNTKELDNTPATRMVLNKVRLAVKKRCH